LKFIEICSGLKKILKSRNFEITEFDITRFTCYLFYYYTDIDECLQNVCLNGAQCVNNLGSYECICASGFFGPSCTFG